MGTQESLPSPILITVKNRSSSVVSAVINHPEEVISRAVYPGTNSPGYFDSVIVGDRTIIIGEMGFDETIILPGGLTVTAHPDLMIDHTVIKVRNEKKGLRKNVKIA
jgi:hypothetical protein